VVARLLVESRPPLKSGGRFAAAAGRVARVEPAACGQPGVGLEHRVLQRPLPLVLRVAQLQQPRLLQKYHIQGFILNKIKYKNQHLIINFIGRYRIRHDFLCVSNKQDILRQICLYKYYFSLSKHAVIKTVKSMFKI